MPFTLPARSLAKSKQETSPAADFLRNAFARLSRTIADFVMRLAFASASSSARRSSGNFNEIVCTTPA